MRGTSSLLGTCCTPMVTQATRSVSFRDSPGRQGKECLMKEGGCFLRATRSLHQTPSSIPLMKLSKLVTGC